MAPVVLDALAAPQGPGRSVIESIVDRLAGRHALIVLDNCEHVIGAACELVRTIRRTCPDVAILATSREALGVAAEHVLPLSSLPTGEASALFVARARPVRPDPDELSMGSGPARWDGSGPDV